MSVVLDRKTFGLTAGAPTVAKPPIGLVLGTLGTLLGAVLIWRRRR